MRVIEGRISSGFGSRKHPITGERSFHNGVDVAAAIGTEVLSPIDGEVKQVYEHRTGGLTLIIGNESMRFGFCHLSKVYFPAGVKVTKGSLIAATGNTGRSTGPHCHFTAKCGGRWAGDCYVGGEWVDASKFLEL